LVTPCLKLVFNPGRYPIYNFYIIFEFALYNVYYKIMLPLFIIQKVIEEPPYTIILEIDSSVNTSE